MKLGFFASCFNTSSSREWWNFQSCVRPCLCSFPRARSLLTRSMTNVWKYMVSPICLLWIEEGDLQLPIYLTPSSFLFGDTKYFLSFPTMMLSGHLFLWIFSPSNFQSNKLAQFLSWLGLFQLYLALSQKFCVPMAGFLCLFSVPLLFQTVYHFHHKSDMRCL